ncbi:phosphoribosylanthranilate isomerase [Sporosarcina sp. G11-34]|uniref:phosphoribosylanthranilate isomerase n=1 Tax=Sporosarcina sp. G11-34 TaxID=2849605 RepID=UPI0022A9CB19|nr:phosphoribosylanthranilate isomerase [Sporosarcina sp. G11-34]MCZ2259082.1 phosphoribosylanthranilate isomerase [Sporosarcina sp. G11-34]
MTKVKICGLMESEHVRIAVDAGADAIGFVFAPSSRRITINEAKELAKYVPPQVMKIGVFVNASREEIERTYKEVPLDFVQFHGEESEEFINSIQLPSIKVFSVHSEKDVQEATSYTTDYYLFDAPGTVYKGGSGVTFDWKLLNDSGIASNKIILAGGLNAENVEEAVRRVQPYMVDVSSGVERNKRKDGSLIKAFISAVKDGER